MTGIEITAIIVGVVTGIGGLTLGIVNTWVQFSNNRVKLRIVPMIPYKEKEEDVFWTTSSLPFPDAMNAIKQKKYRLCAEVTNLSNFAVTINNFGFGKFKIVTDTIRIPFPQVMNKNIWPLKLESRESDFLMVKAGTDIPIEILDKNCAHVVTECGHIAYGTSHAFDAYVEELKNHEMVLI